MSIAGYFEDASSDERRLCCSLWWIERGISVKESRGKP